MDSLNTKKEGRSYSLTKISATIIFIILVVLLYAPSQTPPIEGEKSIAVLEQIEINGAYHELMIRGNNTDNPVLIVVHGGPACSEIPFVRKYQYALEENFTIVHYDQRGSGKSYHFSEDYSRVSSKVLIQDLLELTDYIAERLDTSQIILSGHSYGTYLASQAAKEAPEKYIAYIGIGQVSDLTESEIDSYEYCLSEAENAGNDSDVKKLKDLEDSIKNGEVITPRKYIKKYGGAELLIDTNNDYFSGFLSEPEYNAMDAIRYFMGISVLQDKLISEMQTEPLPELVDSFDIPCYFVMGSHDYMTSTEAAKDYFDSLTAPEKEFVIFEESAHYPQFEEREKFAEWMEATFVE